MSIYAILRLSVMHALEAGHIDKEEADRAMTWLNLMEDTTDD